MSENEKKPTPAKRTKKAPAKKADSPAPVFREIKTWRDCVGQKVKIWHPALGVEFHLSKVLHVDATQGTVLVLVRTPSLRGRYLLPLDRTVGWVK